MNIGVIGSGMIGGTAATLFVRAGHQVAISNSRGPASLTALVEKLGTQARAATVEEASTFGEIVLLAIPFGKFQTLPALSLHDKVVVDAMNYYPQRDGWMKFDDLTSSEVVARHLAGSRLIKAFNTMYYKALATQGRPDAPVENRLALFVAGDDANAKGLVSGLIKEIGFAPIDTGSLRNGGLRQQPGSLIYNRPMTAREARSALVEDRSIL